MEVKQTAGAGMDCGHLVELSLLACVYLHFKSLLQAVAISAVSMCVI